MGRLRVLLVILVSVAIATVFSTMLARQVLALEGRNIPPAWLHAVLNGSFWFGWAALAAPLALLTRRFRIDRAPWVAVPAHAIAVIAASALHVVLQTSTQVFVLWRRLILENAPTLADFRWPAEWQRIFPIQITALIDWEIAIGAGVVGLAHAFFYYRESQARGVREAQLETRLVEAQLQMLQRQLHPHFLFNTLHAISTLMHRDVRTADRVLVQLGDLLRLTLASVSKPEVRLAEEAEFLEKYLQIEQVRLGDRLTTEFDLDPQTLDAVVPALILQPLVENAIKHGIAPLTQPGWVKVTSRRDGEMLVLTVEDSGPGPSERALAALSTGIGLSNTRARLAHQFGPNFRFEFRRQPDGFRVIVGLPFRAEAAPLAPAFVA